MASDAQHERGPQGCSPCASIHPLGTFAESGAPVEIGADDHWQAMQQRAVLATESGRPGYEVAAQHNVTSGNPGCPCCSHWCKSHGLLHAKELF